MSVVKLDEKKFRARSRYRFENGKLRQVERIGETEAKAKAALLKAMTELSVAGGEIKREMQLSELAQRFLDSKADKAPRTVDTYRQTINHLVIPGIGEWAISEATTESLGRFISSVARENGPGAAKACRAVLSGMMGLAARSDAVKVNPVREVGHIKRAGGGAEAIPLDVLPKLIAAVRADERLIELDQADLILFLANTGCRVGEVCALRWQDIDLVAGTASIHGNVIRGKGIGVVLQDHPKTAAGVRTIALSAPILGLLGDRRIRLGSNPKNLVFPTVLGHVRDPRNTSRDWRLARERLGYPNVTTHSFRKTIATALDQAGLTAREIAEYLGHENPSLTQDVYMAKNTGGKRAAQAVSAITG